MLRSAEDLTRLVLGGAYRPLMSHPLAWLQLARFPGMYYVSYPFSWLASPSSRLPRECRTGARPTSMGTVKGKKVGRETSKREMLRSSLQNRKFIEDKEEKNPAWEVAISN